MPATEEKLFTSLRELPFTDLYVSERGETVVQGLGHMGGQCEDLSEAVKADLELFRTQFPSDPSALTDFYVDHEGVRYRVSRMPTVGGTWHAIRKGLAEIPHIGKIGLHRQVVKQLGYLGKRKGLIIFSGETGSGKTTTAYSLLKQYLIEYKKTAVTLENPVEAQLQGWNGGGYCFQVPVERGSFGTMLANSMRWNPKWILIGEVRDPEDAMEAIQAACNGHLVITTMHAGSVQQAIGRILQLVEARGGTEFARGRLADGLAGVINQHLLYSRTNGMRLRAKSLFLGQDTGIRSKIRSGKIEQLGTDIEMQEIRLLRDEPPTGE